MMEGCLPNCPCPRLWLPTVLGGFIPCWETLLPGPMDEAWEAGYLIEGRLWWLDAWLNVLGGFMLSLTMLGVFIPWLVMLGGCM